MAENANAAIRRRVPGLLPSVTGHGACPNPRDAQPERRLPCAPIDVSMVQNFGGDDQGYWKGRDNGARADFLAPKGPSRPVQNENVYPGPARPRS